MNADYDSRAREASPEREAADLADYLAAETLAWEMHAADLAAESLAWAAEPTALTRRDFFRSLGS